MCSRKILFADPRHSANRRSAILPIATRPIPFCHPPITGRVLGCNSDGPTPRFTLPAVDNRLGLVVCCAGSGLARLRCARIPSLLNKFSQTRGTISRGRRQLRLRDRLTTMVGWYCNLTRQYFYKGITGRSMLVALTGNVPVSVRS